MRPLPKGKLPVEKVIEELRAEVEQTIHELNETIENSKRAQAEREQKVEDIRVDMRAR